jgi:SAM-dependent methyltransferase
MEPTELHTKAAAPQRSDSRLADPFFNDPAAAEFVCPYCLGKLQRRAAAITCDGCGKSYPAMSSAVADFAPDDSFDDFFTRTPDLQKDWLGIEMPREEEYEIGLAKRYVAPLMRRLGYQPGARALSAGCGLGAEVDVLTDEGFPSWGIDLGNRHLGWFRRRYPQRLARADMRELPFADEAFDFVISLNTIEHVGTLGDTTKVAPDYLHQRMRALKALLRVTKPGGHVLVSGLSRTIPFDFGHIQDVKGPIRWHSPFEPFLLNYNDIKKMCREAGGTDWARPLPLRGFFSWTRLRHVRGVKHLLPTADWLLGELPHWVYGSWMSPFWIVLIKKSGSS